MCLSLPKSRCALVPLPALPWADLRHRLVSTGTTPYAIGLRQHTLTLSSICAWSAPDSCSSDCRRCLLRPPGRASVPGRGVHRWCLLRRLVVCSHELHPVQTPVSSTCLVEQLNRMLRSPLSCWLLGLLQLLASRMSMSDEELAIFYHSNNLPGHPSLFQRYIVASYFITTVFTTVGFGDIAAVRTVGADGYDLSGSFVVVAVNCASWLVLTSWSAPGKQR
eukprot:22628-Hanusia_phi.AAC.2